MTATPRHQTFFLLLTLAGLALGNSARAQMRLLEDSRRLYTRATYQGVPKFAQQAPDYPGETWLDAFVSSIVERTEPCQPPSDPPDTCTIGSAYSDARQNSLFFPAGIQIQGETAGGWSGDPSGTYEFESRAKLKFGIPTAFDYMLYAVVFQGDWASTGSIGGYFRLVDARSGITIKYLESGTLDETGRMGPGEYILEGVSEGFQFEESWQGTVYFAQWTVDSIPQPLIAHQPDDQTVGCGGAASFSVGISPTAGPVTYQWRRNLVPISNGGGVSGATSSTLSIANACNSSAGYYDVVVTSGSVQEPSRLAQLVIVSTPTGVDDTAPGAMPALSVVALGPNPFQGSTSLRYASPVPRPTRIQIFNVQGARVRTLADGSPSAAGTVTWDGRTSEGARAPAGIYFVRVESGAERWSGRVVLAK